MMEAGLANRILSHREVMISLAGLCLVLLTLLLGRVNSAVILLSGTSESWSFPDTEAGFGTYFNPSYYAAIHLCMITHGHIKHSVMNFLLVRQWEAHGTF